jgi:cell division protein FtsB
MASKKKTEKKRINLLSATLILLMLALLGWQLVSMNEQLDAARAGQAELEERVARQEQENRGLEAALERAEDPEYLQELARENLGMVTPGQKDFYDISK